MYKRIKGKKFSRSADQRKAFIKSLAANLILRGKIKTTKARAKETAKTVEKLITIAKRNDLFGAKMLLSKLPVAAAQKLCREIAPLFAKRSGGYTRVIKLGQRQKDGSEIAIVEFVEKPAASLTGKKGKNGDKKRNRQSKGQMILKK